MHWEPKPKNVFIARLGWTWIIYHNKCNYFSYNFTSLLLLWPPLLHCGTSGLHEHISPPRPHISGYWADLLNTFYSSINQIKENKFWCLFAFQNSALPEKCHSVTTLFHLSMVSFFPFFLFLFYFFGSYLPKSTQKLFSERCPNVLWLWQKQLCVAHEAVWSQPVLQCPWKQGLRWVFNVWTHLMEMEKAQGDKVGVLLLAKGWASPSWIAFLLPPAHVGFREEVGISAPTGDSVSTSTPKTTLLWSTSW